MALTAAHESGVSGKADLGFRVQGFRSERNMKIRSMILFVVAGMVLCCIDSASASPTLNIPQTWTGTSLNGWTNSAGEVVQDNPGTGGNTGGGSDGYMRILFPDQGGFPQAQEDTVYSAEVADSGDYQQYYAALQISFDFLAQNYAPASPALYFQSSVGGSDIWMHSFDYAAASVGSWEEFVVSFNYNPSTWVSQGGGDATAFYNALSAVDWVGINLSRNLDDSGDQYYGIDNWRYSVPEPGSMCMLGVALGSLAVTLRKRKKKEPSDDGTTDPQAPIVPM